MTKSRAKGNIDWGFIIVFGILMAFSFFIMSSASVNVNPTYPYMYLKKQLLVFGIGAVAAFIVMKFDYQYFRKIEKIAYVFIVVMLLGVILFGDDSKGAQRWLDLGFIRFQPSELAKIVMIICYASFLERWRDKLDDPKNIMKAMAYMIFPMMLILVEPDLGTSLVFGVVMLFMLFIAGANRKFMLLLLLILVCLIAYVFGVIYIYTDGYTVMLTEKIPILPLERYQLMRLVIFVNPEMDPTNTGYHVIQSMVAVGSGGLLGQGYRQGSQVQGNFLPEHHTDFIFSVAGEEMGFVFCALLLICYGLLIIRMLKIAFMAKDMMGTLIVIGIATMFLFQVLVNVGMTMGIMPITGLPLPFFSYGGTGMLVNMIAIGLVLSVNQRRRNIVD